MDKNIWNWIRLIGGLSVIIIIIRFVISSPFKDSQWIQTIILKYGGGTGWGLLISLVLGIGITCLVHSSSLVTWVTIGLVASGCIPIHTGIVFIMGANIGTTIDAAIASQLFHEHAAKVVAYSHIIFNFSAVCILFPIFLFVRRWIK